MLAFPQLRKPGGHQDDRVAEAAMEDLPGPGRGSGFFSRIIPVMKNIRKKEVTDMFLKKEVHRDFFWAGLFAGALAGGLLAVLLATDSRRQIQKGISQATSGVKGFIHGKMERDSNGNPAPVEAENPI